MMKSQTLSYTSPLYGRKTGQIKLKQIPFENYKEFFNKEIDERELIEKYIGIIQKIEKKVLTHRLGRYIIGKHVRLALK